MQGQWPLVLGLCLLIHLSPTFNTIERGHVSEDIPSDLGSVEDVPHGGMQIPPCTVQTCVKLLIYPQVVLNTILLFLNQIDCLPTLDLMTMIPCLRLDMVGEQ